MKRGILRVVSGFLSVVMFVVTAVNFSYVSHAENEVVEGAINVTASSVTLERNGNLVAIDDSTEIKDGDKLSLKFAWDTVDDKYNPPITFKYDLKDSLKNISLSDVEIEAQDAIYRISGQTLYIDIQKGSSGRSGYCTLEGEIDLSGAEIDDEGKTVIQFIDKKFTPKVHSDTPALSVYKHTDNQKCEKIGENYYQTFKIEVNNYSNVDITDAKLIDTFTSNDNLFADGAQLEDVVFKDKDGNVIESVGTKPVGSEVELPDISAGEKIYITYKLKVDENKALSKKNGENKATVKYHNDTKESSSWASAYIDLPQVSKTGVLSNDGESITWTITVTPNSMVGAAPEYYVIENPDSSLLDAVKTALGIEPVDGKITIPSDKFVDNGGSVSFTTALPEKYKNQLVDKNVTNNVEAVFTVGTEKYSYPASATVPIKGKDMTLIEKKAAAVNKESGEISWESKIFIPNSTDIKSVYYYDTANVWISGERGNNYFNLVDNKVELLINGSAATSSVGTFESYITNGYFAFKFTSDFIQANLGQYVTIGYKSKMDTSVDNYKVLAYSNEGKVEIKFNDDTSRSQAVTAVVRDKFSAIKTKRGSLSDVTKNNAELKNPLGWLIRFRGNGHTFAENQIITIKDILPEGYTIVDGSQTAGIYNYDEGTAAPYNYGSGNTNIVSYALGEEGGRQIVTFEIKLTAEMAKNLNEWNYSNITVAFDTAMTEEYYKEFNLKYGSDAKVDIVNDAVITSDGEKLDVSSSQTVEVKSDDIITKEITSETQLPNGKFKATYEIVVNKNKADIIEGDVLVLTDKLGTWMDIDMESLNITPSISDDDISYDKSSRTLTLNIKDEEAYTITYDVTGYPTAVKDHVDDVIGVDPSYLDDMYGNTVTLEGKSNVKHYNSVMLSEGSYKANAGYTYSMNLSGTKFWLEDKHAALIPDSVTINIKKTATRPDGTTEPPTYQQENIKVEKKSDGTWSYSCDNLIAMENGIRYEYEVEEIKVGGDLMGESGYEVKYTDVITNTENKNIVINFTNTFVADKEEVGKVKVTKTWDDSISTHPDVIFKLKNNLDSTVLTQTLTSGDTSVTFENVPLYKYSRDVDDKLKRTPYEYSLTEEVPGGYTVSYEFNGSAAAVDGDGYIDIGQLTKGGTKEVSVKNTKNTDKIGDIKVNKTWSTGSTPEDITFTVKNDAGGIFTKTLIAGGTSVIFEDLPVYKADGTTKYVYYVKEATLSGYTVSYEFNGNPATPDNDGYVNVGTLTQDGEVSVSVTNTKIVTAPKTGDIEIKKTWSTGSTPEDITFTVKNDAGDIITKTLIAGGTSVTFEDLPVYKADGTTEHIYYVKEEALSGYTVSYELNVSAVNPDSEGYVKIGKLTQDGKVTLSVLNEKAVVTEATTSKPDESEPTTSKSDESKPTTSKTDESKPTTTKTDNTTVKPATSVTPATAPTTTAPVITAAPVTSVTPATAGTTTKKNTQKTTTTVKPVEITTDVTVVTDDDGETVTDEEGKPVTSVVTDSVIVTETVTDDKGKPVTDDNGKPVTSAVTEAVTVTQTVVDEDGKPVTDDNGAPVTTAVTEIVTDDDGEVVTTDGGVPVTSVVTENVVVTSKIDDTDTTTTKKPDSVSTTAKTDDDSIVSRDDIIDDNNNNDNDTKFDTEENPHTNITITVPAILTVVFGSIAAFSGKKKRK